MIKVDRIGKPQILEKNQTAWTNAIKNARGKDEKNITISKYKHKSIKSKLIIMFHGKCAYCESRITNVDFGAIDHFMPKAIFPEEAVNWDNLFLSCNKCNGRSQKGDAWPSEVNGGPLVNPTKEEPSDFFDFYFDEKSCVTIVKPKNLRGEISEKIFGLNKITLVQDRNIVIKRLVALAYYYHSDTRAKELLNEATESKSEYAAFARMVKKKYT